MVSYYIKYCTFDTSQFQNYQSKNLVTNAIIQ